MKIAAFDSGIGGLTALAPFFKTLSGLEVVYLGDLANLPYGTKSKERVQSLTQKNLAWLLKSAPKSKPFDFAVIACNTASSFFNSHVFKKSRTPIVGVVESGCRNALRIPAPRIVVLATPSTVKSNSYSKKLKALGYKGEIVQTACPLWVPLVEEHFLSGHVTEAIVEHYLAPLKLNNDVVILGCTHYPLLVPVLKKLYPNVKWIDAGASLLADAHIQTLIKASPTSSKKNKLHLYFTDASTSSEKVTEILELLGIADTLSLRLSPLAPLS